MSTFDLIRKKCAVCGTEQETAELMSTNAFGAPDLDMRPPEMQRSTMHLWAQECPSCGYVAADIEDPCPVDPAFLQSEEYRSCGGMTLSSELAARFFRQYLILIQSGRNEEAFHALRHAAWACDDEEDKESAKRIRKLALKIADTFRDSLEPGEAEALELIKADLMRRAGEFNEVYNTYAPMILDDPDMNAVLSFQIHKAGECDDACYTLEDVTGLP